MSKRKRKSESVEESNIEDQITLGTSKGPPNRDDLHDEVVMDIERCREMINKTKMKMNLLNSQVDDFLTKKGLTCLNLANQKCEQAKKFIEDSHKLKWMEFSCIPQIPMRQILRYLSPEETGNLRLTSKSLKNIVDLFHVMHIKFDEVEESDLNVLLLKSNFMFKIEADTRITNFELRTCKMAYMLSKVSHRILGFSGLGNAVKLFSDYYPSILSNLKEIEITHCFGGGGPIDFTLASNLRVLTLDGIILRKLIPQEISLTRLKELHIDRVSGITQVQYLLSAAPNLQTLSISLSRDELMVSTEFNLPRLTKLHLKDCRSEILEVFSGLASNLRELSLDNIYLRHQSMNVEYINLSKLTFSWDDDDFLFQEQYPPYNGDVCQAILIKSAPSIEDLSITVPECRDFFPYDFIVTFPKLTKLSISSSKSEFSDIRTIELTIGIVNQSPNLEHLTIDNIEIKDHLGEIVKLTSRHPSLEELVFSEWDVCFSHDTRSTRTYLKKLSVISCDFQDGFEVFSDVYCSNTEEILIKDTRFTNQLPLIRTSLQKISWIATRDIHNQSEKTVFESNTPIIFAPQVDILRNLLLASSYTLETLILNLPDNTSYNFLTGVQLPKLKLLHVYPKPSKKILRTISKELPKDVRFLFFKLDAKP